MNASNQDEPKKGKEILVIVGTIFLVLGVLLAVSDSFVAPISRRPMIVPLDVNPTDVIAEFPENFLFGLANAPAHVEDNLNDSWLLFARGGGVRAWKTVPDPEARLMFWSQPEIELDLAARTGVKVFRMGIDWSRLCPDKPGSIRGNGRLASSGVQDFEALDRYRQILAMIRERGMKPMVTLFHHSLPQWSVEEGGWTNPSTTKFYLAFAEDVVRELGPLVDYWITFNEPNTFTLLTYIARVWPPIGKENLTGMVEFGPLSGEYPKALQNMTDSHNLIYPVIKKIDPSSKVGIAHLVSENYAQTAAELPLVLASRFIVLLNDFPDKIINKLDFLGINYYGEEVVQGNAIAFIKGREYSDSGRAIYPEGLFRVLMHFHERYNGGISTREETPLPLWVTENGIADENDVLRPAYLIEHLLAIRKAMDEGAPIEGYVFWTVSDNWEWHDGYGPKFGLVEVDRKNNLLRSPRQSYYLFSQIVETKRILSLQRINAWKLVVSKQGGVRNLWRSPDGRHGLDTPRKYFYSTVDWRFPEHPRVVDDSYLDLLREQP